MIKLQRQPRTDASGPHGSAWRCRPEIQLLLCLARAHLSPEDENRLDRILKQPLDWDAFVRLARRHRLLPLCARHLNRLAPDQVPAEPMEVMRRYTEQNVRRSLLLTGELRTIMRLLEEVGIPALAYKGPVLAQDVYGSVALRDMLDLDILVRKGDALRARELLFERGYRSCVPTGARWDSYLLWSGCNFPLIHDAAGFVVELHWTPETCFPEALLRELWQRGEGVSLAGMDVQTFARQDLLLLLCLHGCRHLWERLDWVTGVAELLRVTEVAWDEVIWLASCLGGRRALYLGLALTHELMGAPVPEDVLRRARSDRQMEWLIDAACQQLFSDPQLLAHQLGYPFHAFQLRSKERLRDRVRYINLRLMAPSSADWGSWQMPWSLFRLYCAVRRMRLIAVYARSIWRRSGFAQIGARGGE
jgi:hypothetical protein